MGVTQEKRNPGREWASANVDAMKRIFQKKGGKDMEIRVHR